MRMRMSWRMRKNCWNWRMSCSCVGGWIPSTAMSAASVVSISVSVSVVAAVPVLGRSVGGSILLLTRGFHSKTEALDLLLVHLFDAGLSIEVVLKFLGRFIVTMKE